MAKQLIADLYGCGDIINDSVRITEAAHEAIEFVGAQIVEECVHEFTPVGVTYFAVISTSHFSIHTWPEYEYAAVDIFSCSDDVIDGIEDKLKELFGAKKIIHRLVDRQINSP